MADVAYVLRMALRRLTETVPGKGNALSANIVTATRSVTARAQNDTIRLVRLQSNARIHGLSRVTWADLASSGSPTLSIGIAPVDDAANAITAVNNCLNSGLDLFTAAGSANLVAAQTNFGRMLWEILGLAQDPGTLMDIYATIIAAPTNVTGDITAEVLFSYD